MLDPKLPHDGPDLPVVLGRARPELERLIARVSRYDAHAAMLFVGLALFGIFFYNSLFLQGILGYSPIKTGATFLPMTVLIILFCEMLPKTAAINAPGVSRVPAATTRAAVTCSSFQRERARSLMNAKRYVLSA